ncbi:glycosyltransferase family 2 protein [Butyrivibrio sp. XBB1001]|uniref:glycosyltransferase family 2 protein n=1 Tax=Butyrivibrio sp. XBB1001 TaxID=1280682 RepID=UPI0003FCFCA7|nr:glycosyltransferase family 2 protein [Butyrivibrio sp. XBB1001]
MMKASVIIPLLDEKENLERSIKYLEKQKQEDIDVEIIIVNGLGERVEDRLRKIEQNDPEHIILVMSDSSSKCDLLNLGIDYANGDYVFFLRAGDYLNVKLLAMVKEYDVQIISYKMTIVHEAFEYFELEPVTPDKAIITVVDSPHQRKVLLTSGEVDEKYLCNAYSLHFLRDVGQRFTNEGSDEDISFAYPLFFFADKIVHTADHGYCKCVGFTEKTLVGEGQTAGENRISSRMAIQTELFELIQSIPELYTEYKELVDAHFFKEYYLKNMDIARACLINTRVFNELFKIIKLVSDKVVPVWCENEYLSGLGRLEAETIAFLHDTNQGVEEICKKLVEEGLVSVIIATHNRAQYIARSIECILMQTWKNIELLIIDDGSTDNTEEIVNSFNDQRIVYIKNETNKGVSYSRNRGIRASKGKYIVYQDDDDYCRLDKIEKQVLFMESQSKNVGMAYCMTLNYAWVLDGDLTKPVIRIPNFKDNKLGYQGFIFPRLLRKNFVACTSMIIKRECFDKVGLFDESLFAYEDWDMTLRISKEYDVGYIDEPLYDYYQRNKGLASNQDPRHREKVIKALYDIDVKYKDEREKYGIKSNFILKQS